MALLAFTERSIFFRIYAGLLVICLVVAFFAYLLIDAINQERLENYRESMATGVFYLITQEASIYKQPLERQAWLRGTSSHFDAQMVILPIDRIEFKAKELERLNDDKSVVRYNSKTNETMVYHRIANENNVLSTTITRVGERQVRAVSAFLANDLVRYPSLEDKRGRLDYLSQRFDHPLKIDALSNYDLDPEQLNNFTRGEPAVLFQNSMNDQNPSFSIIMPLGIENLAVEIGPIQLFNWFPLYLVASTVVICLLLISLGVYGLIVPLERRLQLLQDGVDKVAKGDLNTSVDVVGTDDIARLTHTFNGMIKHIKRLIESQRELTRAVSHELRTPVARIRFAVDMLADDDDYTSRQVQKEQIDTDIESLNELIDEILTYAKLEEGSPKMNWEMVGLAELLEQIQKETNALGKSIAVQIVTPAPRVIAMADRRYLHRVVQNLAGNALRYAKSTIIIKAGVQHHTAFVSVEDDGQGIPKADREKVFIPFARLDDSRTRASGGYGLGLSIVSRIAFWFGGNMTVDASPTLGGARFTMMWPVKQVGVIVPADRFGQEKSAQKLIGESK